LRNCAVNTHWPTIRPTPTMGDTTISEFRPDTVTTSALAGVTSAASHREVIKVAREALFVALLTEQKEASRSVIVQLSRLKVISCVLRVSSIVLLAEVMRAKDEKLKPEQVIAKPLESIGPAEKLKAIKNRATNGSAHVDFRVGGQANLPAEANLVSEGSSIR